MRCAILPLLFVSMMVGCQHPHHHHHDRDKVESGPPKKPERSPEMAKLEPLIGQWAGTAEMVFPELPKGQKNTFVGEGNYSWTLGGMFLKAEGWHEMGEGQRESNIEYTSWDSNVGKFHTIYMSDWGECSEGWMSISDDGKTFSMLTSGMGPDRKSTKGQGTMTLVDNNTIEWSWSEESSHGTIKLQGTMRRK